MLFLQSLPEGATLSKSIDLLDLFFKGGWVMYPLLLLSIVVFIVVVDRLRYYSKQSMKNTQAFDNFVALMKAGKRQEALNFCEKENAAWSRIFQFATLTEISEDEREKLMETAANVEVNEMEKRLNVLSIVAGVAPLLGFIGTIAGVITIFFDISMTADISIGTISEGLYQKMVSSAGGLVVGILAFVFYHALRSSVDKFAAQMEEFALQLKVSLLTK